VVDATRSWPVEAPGEAHPTLTEADVAALLESAVAAPSLHNTQPWRFGVGAHHIEVYADRGRQLAATDREGRELLVSCGAALLNLRVAVSARRLVGSVTVLPRPEQPDLVAVVTVTERRALPGSLAIYQQAVADRRTNRQPFEERAVPADVVDRLEDAAMVEGALLYVNASEFEAVRLAELFQDADAADRWDRDRVGERRKWIGSGEGRDDGVPAESLGPRPGHRSFPVRDLRPPGPAPYARFERAPMIAVLSTHHDEPADWVRAGQALQRVLLEATRHGVSASFLNGPLEHPELRWLVRHPTLGTGHPQMIIRLGYGPEVPATPRRPVADVRVASRLHQPGPKSQPGSDL
jgi:nitroreductase